MNDSLTAVRDHLKYRLDNSPGWPDDATLLRVSYDGGPEHRLTCGQAREALAEIDRLTSEVDRLRQRLLSAAGDDLCRLSQEEIKAMSSGAVKIPPKEEFLASCERFHTQVSQEAGVMGNCLTLAQLIAENAKLEQQLTAERDARTKLEERLSVVNYLSAMLEQQLAAEREAKEAAEKRANGLHAQCAHWERIAQRLASDALVALSRAVPTPEKDYLVEPHCLRGDICALTKMLGETKTQLSAMTAERDALLAKQAPAGFVPVEACKSLIDSIEGIVGHGDIWAREALDRFKGAVEAAKSGQPDTKQRIESLEYLARSLVTGSGHTLGCRCDEPLCRARMRLFGEETEPSAPATGVGQQVGEGHELPFVHFLKLCLSRAATAGSTVRWPDDYPLLSQRFNDVEAVLTVGGARQAVQQIETMQERAEKSEAELARLNDALSRESNDIEQLLGKALDYPECYPDISDVDDGHVCVGEHVPATIAAEAAAKIMSLKAELARIREALTGIGGYKHWITTRGWEYCNSFWLKDRRVATLPQAILTEVAAIVGKGDTTPDPATVAEALAAVASGDYVTAEQFFIAERRNPGPRPEKH